MGVTLWDVAKKTILIVPNPTLVGREELYTQLGFFVQTILADRYIHHRKL